MKLSILDLCPVVEGQSATETLQHTKDLAVFADKLGFARFWLAEHHSMAGIASSSPEILISHVAQGTKQIRVGSGGMMLPNHSSLKVAELFRTLEALYPNRIDLGLGRAPGTHMRVAMALRGSDKNLAADNFPEQVNDLISFLTDNFAKDHPYSGMQAMPTGVSMPELWILGSSDYGARMAGDMGVGYGFAHHFSTLPAREVMKLYRERFTPSVYLNKPHAILTSSVILADTEERAEELSLPTTYSMALFRQTGRSAPMPTIEKVKSLGFSKEEWAQLKSVALPKFVGTPESIGPILREFVRDCEADEFMVTTMVPDHEARKRSYELLKTIFD